MTEYQTYIFDLDGTLLNTLDDLAISCNDALALHGMPERSVDEVRRFVGNGVKKLMERAVPEGIDNSSFDEVYQDFKRHYLVHCLDHTSPYPGIMDLLQNLHEHEKKMAVVSNKYYNATHELCNHFFGKYIHVAIGQRESIRMKPAPDTVLEALSQLGVGAENAVYIGDSNVDIETARNCGIPCLSVLWGFRNKDFLLAHGATTLITSPKELMLQ